MPLTSPKNYKKLRFKRQKHSSKDALKLLILRAFKWFYYPLKSKMMTKSLDKRFFFLPKRLF